MDVQEIIARRPAPRPAGGGGGGGFLGQFLAAIPVDKPLPADLKAKADAVMASGDRSQMRPLMQEIRAWAEKNGVEMPAGRGGPGGGPRG